MDNIVDFGVFTREKWNAYEEKRYEMLEDFLKKYDLEGMEKEEIKKLLGNRYVVERKNELAYVIRKQGIFFQTKTYFVVFFDKNNIYRSSTCLVDTSNTYG